MKGKEYKIACCGICFLTRSPEDINSGKVNAEGEVLVGVFPPQNRRLDLDWSCPPLKKSLCVMVL